MAMEQISNWEAAVLAAGMTTVYNADDWDRIAEPRASEPGSASSEGTTSRY